MRGIQWYQEKIVNSLPGMLIRGGWSGLGGAGDTTSLPLVKYAVLEHIPVSSQSPILIILLQDTQHMAIFHTALRSTEILNL